MDKLTSFQLFVEKVKGVQIEETDIASSKEVCGRSLVGEIYDEKRVSFIGLRNTMTTIWLTKELFNVRELEANLFQFAFSNQEDKKKVANGKVWAFDQQYLILKD